MGSFVVYCRGKVVENMRKKRRGTPPATILLIVIVVAVVFGVLFGAFELVGRYLKEREREPEPEVVETDEPWHPTELIPGLPVNEYDTDAFRWDGNYLVYDGPEAAHRGIDVSDHQGEIDWAAVASDGVEYAMLRVGYRGYTEGTTSLDAQFYDNVAGARENGIAVGVYFFSQAINEEEAREEADIVLRAIEGLEITYPIVFDWEDVGQPHARTANMTQQQLTACAKAFCEEIEAAGYTAGIYFNQIFGYQWFQLPDLTDYMFWLAEYGTTPDFVYDFQMWQYTNEGTVSGIEGGVDLNLSFWEPEQ